MQLFQNIIQKIKCHKNEKEESDHFDRFSAVGCTGAVLVKIYFTFINTEGERVRGTTGGGQLAVPCREMRYIHSRALKGDSRSQ